MSGYTRQSAADIVPTAVVKSAPINVELNKLRDAFDFDTTGATGHHHDGTSDEGSYVPLIADVDGLNKFVVDTANNRISAYVEITAAPVEQFRIEDGVIYPVTDNDIDLGTAVLEYKNVYVDGTAFIDTVSIGDADTTVITGNNYAVTGDMTFDVSGNIILDADGGNVSLKDAGTTYATLTSNSGNLTLKSGTTIAATFTGANVDLAGTLDVTGAAVFDSTVTVLGNTTLGDAATDTVSFVADVASNIIPSADSTYTLGDALNYWSHAYLDAVTTTGNVSIGANLTVNGTADFTNTTLVNVSDPTSAQHAATKNYVDTAINDLIGGAPATLDTLNEIAAAINDDAAVYTTLVNLIATKLNLAGGSMTGAIAMGANKITGLGTPTTGTDATTKTYVDGILGSATAAAASASAAATSETNAEAAWDSFDDKYLGAKATAPTLDNDGDALTAGVLYFNTTAEFMYVYTGSSWALAGSAVNGTSARQTYTATAAQTTFAIVYDVGFVDVYLNGVKQLSGTDFTATDGTSVVLTTGAAVNDIVDMVAFGTFEVANVLTPANNLSDVANVATSRTNLGLVIGTDVMAYDATMLVDADIGVNVQAYDATYVVDADIGVTVQAYDATYVVDADIGVSVQGYDVDTAKLDVIQTFTAAQTVTAELKATSYNETYVALSGTTPAIDCETGNVFGLSTTGSTTFTFTNPPTTGTAYGFILRLTAGGTHTITYPASVDWAAATAPDAPASGETDVLVFTTTDGGTTWYGAISIDAAG